MYKSYSNVGKHLQILATFITMLIDIAGCLIGFMFIAKNTFIGILVIVISIICGYLSSILLRAFGVLVDSVVNIDRTLDTLAFNQNNDNYNDE